MSILITLKQRRTLLICVVGATVVLLCSVAAPPAQAWKAGGHYIEAEKVMQGLPNGSVIKAAMAACPWAAAWGSYGADLGYGGCSYFDLGRGYTQWADKLHYQRAGTLARLLLQRALVSGDQEQIAFAAGYLTHTTGDLACHGTYVNPEAGGVYFANEATHDRHFDLEKWAEPYVWQDLGGHPLYEYNPLSFPTRYAAPTGATRSLFASALSDVYGESPGAGGFADWLDTCYANLLNPLYSYVGGLYCDYNESAAKLNVVQPNALTRRQNIDLAMARSTELGVQLLAQAEAGDYSGLTDTWNLDVGERPHDEFGELTVRIHTADVDDAGTNDQVCFLMYLADGTRFDPTLDIGGNLYDDFEPGDNDWYFLYVPGRSFRPDTIKRIELWKSSDGFWGGWRPDHISVWANGTLVVDQGIDKWLQDDDRKWTIPVDWRVDTTPPAITVPANMTVEATGADGAIVPFSASANDLVDGSVSVTYSKSPGTVFPLGSTTVSVSAADAHGNAASKSFTVTVVDTTPPVIAGVPADMRVVATHFTGAVAGWTAPTASDLVDGSVAVVCSPASGTVFALGATNVTVTATDASGNTATAHFTVSVSVSWSNVLPPINVVGPRSIFKAGSTMPVRFQLTGASAVISNLVARISWVRIDGDAGIGELEAVNSNPASTGSLFRYDTGLYIYNLGTKGWRAGTWQIIVDLGDGVLHNVLVDLK